jgi:very-short-patch-repair endonuclease
MTYPVIKVPPLIAKTKPKQLTKQFRQEQSIDTSSQTRSMMLLKYPRIVNIFLRIGCLFLLATPWIFAISIIYNPQWLIYSLLSCILGLGGINIAGLIAEDRILVSIPEPYSISRSIQTVTKSELMPIDWPSILQDNIMPHGKEATAQVGVSEAYFESYLKKYFRGLIYPGYEFKINDTYSYSSDFTMILSNGLKLIIEIDEPYVGKTGSPHHCTDNDKDTNRDLFFLDGNWIVIRFSEFQVCAYPQECCYTIAQTIDRLNHNNDYSSQFKGIGALPFDRQWTSREAAAMAKKGYRREYLAKYNIYHERRSSKKSH